MTDQYDSLGKIFIAGTGRSGTTVLHRMLGRHPDAFQIPFESKFIVESDGLNALIPRLHADFSVTASHLALMRFIEMMDGNPQEGNGRQLLYDSSLKYYEHIGREFYFPPLNEFITNLIDFTYNDCPFPIHFKRREELISLTRRFVATMFGAPTLAAGKKYWVEKTPSNVIAMDFLWELFPEATIIHIKRDPRGVLFSFLQQDWLPRDLAHTARFLSHIYWRWMKLKPNLDLANKAYVEIKLEELVCDPADTMGRIAKVAGISDSFNYRYLNPEVVDRWKLEMPVELRRYAERELAPYFNLMGYDQ